MEIFTKKFFGDAIMFAINYGHIIYMSHFAYACKMRCLLNLVLENSEYLWFY